MSDMKFCKHCGEKIVKDAVICNYCGRQVEELKGAKESGNIVINNSQQQQQQQQQQQFAQPNPQMLGMKLVEKNMALILCLLLGWLGAHKFYEGKTVLGIIYFFTGGLFLIGVVIDFLSILGKPSKYYV